MSNQPTRENISVRLEKALLIGLELPDERGQIEETLAELRQLADTAGAEVVGEIVQRREAIDPGTYLGKGKALEAHNLANALDANIVIADGDLTPAQLRNLEKLLKRTVVDRTELILDIFARHARTHQAKVQVELAQAEYALPRLKRMWTHLHRERGGRGFVGGAGERQIELDRRMIRKRITDNKRELDQIRKRKARTLDARRDLFSIALVGYTNAGKSTLMNALTDAQVLVQDQLFATLDTRTRVWQLGGHFRCLLSDTVGFIRKLPHHLIEAFHATLDEATEADLLLHVVDASHPEPEKHIDAVNTVLRTLGCQSSSVLTVFNKIDRVERRGDLQFLLNMYHDSVALSAHTGENLEALVERVKGFLREREVTFPIRVEAGNGKLLAFLQREAEILDEDWKADVVDMTVRMDPRMIKKVEELRWNRETDLPRVDAQGRLALDELEETDEAPLDAREEPEVTGLDPVPYSPRRSSRPRRAMAGQDRRRPRFEDSDAPTTWPEPPRDADVIHGDPDASGPSDDQSAVG